MPSAIFSVHDNVETHDFVVLCVLRNGQVTLHEMETKYILMYS